MSGPFVLNFMYGQLLFTPPKPTQKYTNQTIIVTGSNIGLGLEAARWFVKLDAAKVILAVRSSEKGERAKKDIETSTGRTGIVEVWPLDLSSYESVIACARKAEGLERLDVVVENAGIVTYEWNMMEENEATVTTNVVTPLLHAILSLPKLRETSVKHNTVPKIVFTTSFVHWITPFVEQREERIFDALADKSKWKQGDRYNVSKLLEMYCVRALASAMTASKKPGKVIINHIDPGWVKTNIMQEYSGITLVIFKIASALVARQTEVGARTLMAGAQGGDETHGQYLHDCVPSQTAPVFSSEHGQQLGQRVWDELAEKLETIQPGILGLI